MPTGNEYSVVMFGGGPTKESDYGQETGAVPSSPSDDMVPNPVRSMQFSSDVDGDPKVLLQDARQGVDAHADLIKAFGYHQPVATMGSHPWLRDELANPTELEPGNAEPGPGMKVPERATAGK